MSNQLNDAINSYIDQMMQKGKSFDEALDMAREIAYEQFGLNK